MNYNQQVRLRVWGDYACFTRPEMKVERVSYDVMTPSAARGVLEAILWKPAIVWRISRIDVLKPIKWASVQRNEVSAKASKDNAKTAMNRGLGNLGIYVEDFRQQRAGLVLRDVEYLIHARYEFTDKAHENDNPAKFSEMFYRRARNGQCFNQPYLGCREFSAKFEVLEPDTPLPKPIEKTGELGWMLYDMNFSGEEPEPRFFRAELKDGTMTVPEWESKEVRG
jgi:CRISPR-associated protein Cas5d